MQPHSKEELSETTRSIVPPETHFSISLIMMVLCLIGCGWPFFICTLPALLLSIKVNMAVNSVSTVEVLLMCSYLYMECTSQFLCGINLMCM